MRLQETLPSPSLIFFAVKEEAAPFRAWLLKHHWQRQDKPTGSLEETYTRSASTLHLCITGMGEQQARSACLTLLERLQPAQVFTCGFAGALDPVLRVGDVLYQSQERIELPGAGLQKAVFFSSPQVVQWAREKAALFQSTHCQAVEMESSVIMKLCHERGIACTCVRAISDLAQEDLPLDFGAFTQAGGTVSIPRLMCHLATHPWKIPALVRLGKNSTLAAKKLALALGEIVGESL